MRHRSLGYILAIALACGPVGPASTTGGTGTGSSGDVSTADSTASGTEQPTTSEAGDPDDPEGAALALECLGRSEQESCHQAVAEGSPGRCVWLPGRRLEPFVTRCDTAVSMGVCVAMRKEDTCLDSCGQFWLETPEGLVIVGTIWSGHGFCFDIPVGWHPCSDDRPECACCFGSGDL